MYRILSLALLAFVSFSVLADGIPPGPRTARRVWDSLVTIQDVTLYVNPGSIHPSDDYVDIWALIDFERPQQDPEFSASYSSEVFEERFDCALKKHQVVALLFHPARMGFGPAIRASYQAQKWQPVDPESSTSSLMALACEKAKRPADASRSRQVRGNSTK